MKAIWRLQFLREDLRGRGDYRKLAGVKADFVQVAQPAPDFRFSTHGVVKIAQLKYPRPFVTGDEIKDGSRIERLSASRGTIGPDQPPGRGPGPDRQRSGEKPLRNLLQKLPDPQLFGRAYVNQRATPLKYLTQR